MSCDVKNFSHLDLSSSFRVTLGLSVASQTSRQWILTKYRTVHMYIRVLFQLYSLLSRLAFWNPDHEERAWSRHQVLQGAHWYPGRSPLSLSLPHSLACFSVRTRSVPSCDLCFFFFPLLAVRTLEERLGASHRRLIGRRSSGTVGPPDCPLLTVPTVALFCLVSCVGTKNSFIVLK